MSRSGCLGLLIAMVAIEAGCGSRPVPMDVVEGTTMMLALPPELQIGYGLAWAGLGDETITDPTDPNIPAFDASGPEDLQRGEMIFLLSDPNDPTFGPLRLPVRYIGSVAMDPSSTHALDDTSVITRRQHVAFLDLPSGLVDDGGERPMEIMVRRYRRVAGVFQLVPHRGQLGQVPGGVLYDEIGWGKTNHGRADLNPIPVTVVDDPSSPEAENPTPLEGWYPYWWVDGCTGNSGINMRTTENFTALLDDAVPNPEFYVEVWHASGVHAWEVDLTFPRHRMEILGAHLERENASSALVSLQAEAPETSCTSDDGTITLQVVDTEGRSSRARIAFRMINTDDAGCRTPIDAQADLTMGVTRAYDANGVELTGATFTTDIWDL